MIIIFILAVFGGLFYSPKMSKDELYKFLAADFASLSHPLTPKIVALLDEDEKAILKSDATSRRRGDNKIKMAFKLNYSPSQISDIKRWMKCKIWGFVQGYYSTQKGG